MKKMFSGGAGREGAWPLSKIVSALKTQYGEIDALGEDGPLKVFGVQDNGVNFVVALMQTARDSGHVVELGFLARFVGFAVTAQTLEGLNRNLHVSVAAMEGADMFLMAGMQVTGRFDDGQFKLLLESWRRDLMVTLHRLGGEESSLADAFPAARMAAARNFAANAAPAEDKGLPFDLLSGFLGAKASLKHCDECNGRGKRGLIARRCETCEGVGYVSE